MTARSLSLMANRSGIGSSGLALRSSRRWKASISASDKSTSVATSASVASTSSVYSLITTMEYTTRL